MPLGSTHTKLKTICIRKEEFSDLQNIWLTGFDDLERCQKTNEAHLEMKKNIRDKLLYIGGKYI